MDLLKQELSKLIAKTLGVDIADSGLENPKDPSHGEYATTIALKHAKKLGVAPQALAQKYLDQLESVLAKDYTLTLAGPGFINIKLKDHKLLAELAASLELGIDKYRIPEPDTTKTIIVEYSDPNIAKPLGIHHLLATIIGQSLSNLYRFLGYKVLAINYIGDYGTQFGKLIYAIKTYGNQEEIAKDPIKELLKLYVRFHDELEKDPSLADFGRLEFKKLEDGDQENRKLWQWICEVSMQDVNRTYELLGGIQFDQIVGESFFETMMDPIVEMGLEQKVFSVGEGGAIVAEFSDEKLPTTIVKRSDGATVYLTRDLANLKYRMDNYDPAKILYVVDVAQKLHFEQVRAISQNLNFIPKDDTIFEHVIFGRMSFADGNMSTRKGNIIELNDVLEEGISRSLAIINEKKAELTETEAMEVSRKVGIGCIKYAILCQNRTTNIVFSWDKVINFEGNSAAYLQYTYARTSSIAREAANLELTNNFSAQAQSVEPNDHERQLIAKLIKFPETLYEATHEQKPHLLADYLFKLAHQFNAFYTNCPVLKAEATIRDFRLALTSHVASTIKTGLDLLGGIEVPEKM